MHVRIWWACKLLNINTCRITVTISLQYKERSVSVTSGVMRLWLCFPPSTPFFNVFAESLWTLNSSQLWNTPVQSVWGNNKLSQHLELQIWIFASKGSLLHVWYLNSRGVESHVVNSAAGRVDPAVTQPLLQSLIGNVEVDDQVHLIEAVEGLRLRQGTGETWTHFRGRRKKCWVVITSCVLCVSHTLFIFPQNTLLHLTSCDLWF